MGPNKVENIYSNSLLTDQVTKPGFYRALHLYSRAGRRGSSSRLDVKLLDFLRRGGDDEARGFTLCNLIDPRQEGRRR